MLLATRRLIIRVLEVIKLNVAIAAFHETLK
jgi:hypothetical protein